MLSKLFAVLVLILAIVVGLMTMVWREQLIHLIVFRDFFDVALPILGFGALVKYLFTRCSCNK